MSQYINIHTHHLPKTNEGIFLLNHRFGVDNEFTFEHSFSTAIHPWDTEIIGIDAIQALEQLITHEKCIAIGECGLDKLKGTDLYTQKKIFNLQLQLAANYSKPVIIHCVKVFDELIEVCEPYHKKSSLIIHGFNKSANLANQLINKGFYLSFGYSSFNKKVDNLFRQIPIEKLFLETDNNSTFSIEDVYKTAAKHFNIELNELKEKIYINFETIFYKNGR